MSGRLALGRAQSAARAGDLDRAVRLLGELDGGTASSSAALDLRARVHAQRGELTQADGCWARVLRLDPDDRDARAGRETVARIKAGGRRHPLLTPGRTSALAAVLLTGALLGLAQLPVGHSPGRAAAPAPDAEIGHLNQQLASLRAASASEQAAATRRTRRLDALAAALAMPGVRVDRRPDDVQVVFRAGVFRSGTELAGASEALLAEVGHRLGRQRATTTVVGHAVAVPGGVTSGGSMVAYARAQVCARLLARAAGLPLTAFTLVTADQSEGPFPDAPRNRTVTLIVRPLAEPR